MPTPPADGLRPPAHEVHAPPDWRVVDFISDLHLCAALPRTFAAFRRYLASTPADAVFILGDLFEVWVGDDMGEQPFERLCLTTLKTASQRLMLGYMVGNRDFLAATRFIEASGMQALPDPTLLRALGQRVLLSHGDAWCLDDLPYQAFRQEVRSPAWQTRFLSQPLTERLRIAAEIRQASQRRQQFDGNPAVDVDAPRALQELQHANAQTLVHGHTHRPASHPLGAQAQRHVLSDWDLDQGNRAEVLRLTAAGYTRLPVQAD